MLFPFYPAASPAVSVCLALGKRILFYWFVVFLLVMSLVALPYVSSNGSPPSSSLNHFVSTVVFVAGFFSFVFGASYICASNVACKFQSIE